MTRAEARRRSWVGGRPSGRGEVVDSQLTLRTGKATGVVPATTANSGQGKHRAGRDSLGHLRSVGAGHDF
jgi:hypothetical protein